VNQDRFDLVSHNAVSIAEGVRRVKVFSLCFHTGCMTGRLKVLALSVLRGFPISKGVTRQKQAEMHKALAKRQFRLWLRLGQ